jgi:oligopeptide/dipeptide ABC transporter ATP-binding protein
MSAASTVLKVSNLKTYFDTDEGTLKAVDGVSFDIEERKILGLIGESGCGKSVTAQSILRIVPNPGRIVRGSIVLHRRDGAPLDLCQLDPTGGEVRGIRGKEISMIFQEPMTSLSPVHTIGDQVTEAILLHTTRDRMQARDLAIDMLRLVGIPNPGQRYDEFPHQLSGGLRQRAMIGMALACNPLLLIADEPTTALDVTVQAQILELIQSLQETIGMSVLYITHDLGVIAEIAERVAVMYLGRIVESAGTVELFRNPQHPYTVRLLKSIPRFESKAKVRLDAIEGTVPTPLGLPWQCGFYGRCPQAVPGLCDREIPRLMEIQDGHWSRCFLQHREKEQKDE